MKKNSITELELERQEFKVKLKRGINGGMMPAPEDLPVPLSYVVPQQIAAPGQSAAPAISNAVSGETDIKSPMIGTFYRSPSPDSAPYVEVGTEVNQETIVCIIEAMKVMNEIKAEARGVITQIAVESGKPVEFGQPLFKIRPL